jgi:hypothetical protein
MFKCLNARTGEEIVILAPRWRQGLAELRVLDRQDALVCPGCEQPVRVRVGVFKRSHFAHKHLDNCPLGQASPALLAGRAWLYDWLAQKFGPAVTVEKELPSAGLPRPVDVWLEQAGEQDAYWLVDVRMQPADRAALLDGLAASGARAHFLFLAEMLHADPLSPGRLYLTTTERAFMQATAFDLLSVEDGSGETLHYLNPESGVLATYRGLRLVHSPQVFEGWWVQHPLAAVGVVAATGEPIHPGEIERIQALVQTAQAARLQRAAEWRSRERARLGRGLGEKSRAVQAAPVNRQPFARQATCRVCGRQTTDWVTLYSTDNTCLCRECQGEGKIE